MVDKIEELLWQTIESGELTDIRAAFTSNPDYVRRLYRGSTSWLTAAVAAERPEAIPILLEAGCQVDQPGHAPEETPLWEALSNGFFESARILLEAGANPNGKRCVVAAISGIEENSLELVQLLEKHGADLHCVEENEFTGEPMNALSTAIAWGKDDVTEFLVSKGVKEPK